MSLFVRDTSPFSQAAQQALDATGQQLTVQLEVRTSDGKKAWRTICTYSDTVPAPKPEETWRRMWDLAGLLDEPQRSNIREKIEMERCGVGPVSVPTPRKPIEIEPEPAPCPYCRSGARGD